MTETLNLNDLPLETFIEILLKIDGTTLGRCRRVCKQWKECIDEIDHLWFEMCKKEFRHSSKLAKTKSGHDSSWYHIFKNLKLWSDVSHYEINVKEFYKFNIHDRSHLLNIDYGLLPLRDARGGILYDMSTLKYIPVSLPDQNILKLANNDFVTVIQLKSGILIQRTVETPEFGTEEFFKADNFILTNDALYFHNHRDIFKCDLLNESLTPKLIIHCDYDIKEMQYYERILHIFTDCGKIVNINKNKEITVQSLRCPIEWIRQIKYINAINDKNFVCYSRNLFKIETDKYQHLYLEFPPITALFFYVDVVLIGTREGEILLYRLSSQKKATRPIFETLTTLPDGKFAVQLDVCEKITGPTIVASTFFELFHLNIIFFPNEQKPKQTFSTHKCQMYKRLLKLNSRLQNS